MNTYEVTFDVLENEKWKRKTDTFQLKEENKFIVIEEKWKQKYKDISHKILVEIRNCKDAKN